MTVEEGLKQGEQGYQKIVEASSLMNDALMNAFLFTWRWWLGIALIIAPWVLWFIFGKKESRGRLLLAGFTSMLLASAIESVALSLGKWSYPFTIVPFFPTMFISADWCILPVAVMSFIQMRPKYNPFLKAIVFGVIGAFILEPIFEQLYFYNSKGWPHIYDFFIHSSIFLISYWISKTNAFEKIGSEKRDNRVEYKYSFDFSRSKGKAR